jgi:hypothetical protein
MTEQNEWELVDLGLPAMPGLCLVTYRQRDGSFQPRLVAQLSGAVAYSAAWCDRAGEVKEWFDLWVQELSSWQLAATRHLLAIDNPALDHQWRIWCQGMASAHPANVFHLGLDQHPVPIIWLAQNGPSRLVTEQDWVLCTDDALLRRNRLAAYSDSLHRYLWNRNEQHPTFVATTPGAPEGPMTQSAASVFGDAIPLNPGGSLMALHRSYSIPLGDFIDILADQANPRDIREALRTPPDESNRRLIDKAGLTGKNPGFFFQKNQAAGHLCELLHLKLAVIHGVFLAAGAAIRNAGCPFLGLNPDCFGVSLPQPATSLPFLWSHEVSLQAPPQCVRTMVGDVGEPCFVPHPDLRQSLYRSPRVLTEIRGLARVRLRKISEPDDQGLVVMEGTLLSEEPLHAGRHDLLSMEWVLPKLGRLCIYAKIEGKTSEANGEYRFCSLQTKLQPEVKEWLDSGKGSLTSDRLSFQLLPRIGTPCDLYSLGVIALRILLHHPDGLAASLDDLLSLARNYRQRYSNANWITGTASLLEFAKTGEAGPIDDRLGPQWLLANSDTSASDAFREIPPALWWATIDFLTRLFPGEALDTFCKSHDDFQPRALHEVLVAPIAALETLLTHSRELLFGNPAVNRELKQAIQQARAHR